MKGKSKVKSQKAKVKSASIRSGYAARNFAPPHKPGGSCVQLDPAALLTFDFCLLTFDLPFDSPLLPQ